MRWYYSTQFQAKPAFHTKGGFQVSSTLGIRVQCQKQRLLLDAPFTGRSSLSEEAVVIAVRFETLAEQRIEEGHSGIHVYKPEIQPEILGYCTVPVTYMHK
jgi:hypothetical protein